MKKKNFAEGTAAEIRRAGADSRIGLRVTALLLSAALLAPAFLSCSDSEGSGTQADSGIGETTASPVLSEPAASEVQTDPEPEPTAEPEQDAPSEPAAPEPEPVPDPEPAEETPAPEQASEEAQGDTASKSWSDPERYALYLGQAKEYAGILHDLYWDAGSELSSLTPGAGVPHLWPYTEQLGMVNGILAAMQPDDPDRAFYTTWLDELVGGLRHYRIRRVKLADGQSWNDPDNVLAAFGENDGTAHSYALYSSSRHDKKQDYLIVTPDAVYFDDNVWVAKELVAAYVNTGNEAYLNEAVNVVNWILGEGYENAGALAGIYWKWSAKFLFAGGNYSDSDHASLNACSTVSCAMVLAELCEAVPGTAYEDRAADWLAKADAILRFSDEAFRDRGTKCLYDKVFLKKGFEKSSDLKSQIQKTDNAQYAYNTGTYLTAGAVMFRLLSPADPDRAAEILSNALASAKGADKKFADKTVKAGQYSYPSHSWFTSFLLSGFSDLRPYGEDCGEYADHMRSALDYAWENNRASDGLVSPSWIKGWTRFTNNSPTSEDNPRQILYQSANVHCYAMLAEYYG